MAPDVIEVVDVVPAAVPARAPASDDVDDAEAAELAAALATTKAQLGSLQYVDSELARLQAQAAALQTARIAYGRALKETLENGSAPKQEEVAVEGLGDTIQFDK